MKTQKFLAVASVLALALAVESCHTDNGPLATDPSVVKFSSGTTAIPQSRVAIDSQGKSIWDAGDPVGIYMVEHGTTTVAENAGNMLYQADGSGASTSFTASGVKIYYPVDETKRVDFIAYHPYNASVTGYSYPIDLSDQSSQTDIDLLYARADNSGAGYNKEQGRNNLPVDFTFDHQLVKLIFTVTSGEGIVASDLSRMDDPAINGMNTSASFDLEGVGGIAGAGIPGVITPFRRTGVFTYEVILLPVAVLGTAHTVTFELADGDILTWKMYEDIPSLEPGKIYNYLLTLRRYSVSATGSINNWGVGSNGTGVAE